MKALTRKNYAFSTLIFFALIISSLLLLTGCLMKNEPSLDQPFLITVTNPDIQEKNDGSYLFLNVEIMNRTENDYSDVQYSIKFNEEISPYIASRVIEFKSDLFNVTTPEKALANKSSPLLVVGFNHNWSLGLTEESNLKEYANYNLEQLAENLNTVTVLIEWNNGKQELIQNVSVRN
ncbi:MAG: hypothetical protein WBI17_02480 [Clostridiaceae bacterium]